MIEDKIDTQDNLIDPSTNLWLGFLSIFMDYTFEDNYKELEDCVIGYNEDETPIFDDEKVKRVLERKGERFRPYFEEMQKVINDGKKRN